MGKRERLCADGIRLCLCKRTLATDFYISEGNQSYYYYPVSYGYFNSFFVSYRGVTARENLLCAAGKVCFNLVLRQKFTSLK